VPPEPNLPDDVIVELERRVLKRRRRADALQVEEHALRIADLFFVVAHLGIEVDRDSDSVGHLRPADVLEQNRAAGRRPNTLTRRA